MSAHGCQRLTARNILLVRAKTGLPVKTIFANALNDLFRAHNIPVIDERAI